MLEETIIIAVKRLPNNFFCRLSKEDAKDVIENLDNEKAFDFLKSKTVDKKILEKEFDQDDFMTYPLIFVDFDRKKLVSSYSEMDYSFEKNCSKNYVGIYGDCLSLIPDKLKYWK